MQLTCHDSKNVAEHKAGLPGSLRAARVVAAMVPMGLILISSFLKLANLEEFAKGLSAWRLIPGEAVGTVAAAVPLIELGVSGAWLLGVAGKGARRVAAAMLLVWTLAYIAETVLFGAPDCNCFGKLLRWHSERAELPWVVGRNALMCVGCLVGLERKRPTKTQGGDR
jgi:hypothetical protein